MAKTGPLDKPEDSYADIIAKDGSGAPDFLKHAADRDIGTHPVSVERYWSKDFYDLENKYLWSRSWQMACLESDIPSVGDCHLYEIADRSLIITRTETGIKAFHNSCLHRGRKLITHHCKKREFECPFHAITWDQNGKLIRNPIAWDMPQWDEENSRLPEAKTALWGGFIFINMDLNSPDFEDWAAPMIEHFKPYGWDNRYCGFWFEKHVRANWKTTAEPFMESHHSQTTHPQLLPAIADTNSQYDFLNNYISRQISAAATASPTLHPPLSQNEQIELMLKRGDSRVQDIDPKNLPENFRIRTLLADQARDRLAQSSGENFDHATDAEMLDYILYGLFPNMTFWAGYGPKLVYRWRPEPGNPEGSIMDVLWMVPKDKDAGEGEEPTKRIVLGYDDRFMDSDVGPAPLKIVFDQDFGNIPHIQTGMKSSQSGVVHFSEYTESRLRQMHQMIDAFIETGQAGEPPPKA